MTTTSTTATSLRTLHFYAELSINGIIYQCLIDKSLVAAAADVVVAKLIKKLLLENKKTIRQTTKDYCCIVISDLVLAFTRIWQTETTAV